MNFEPYDDIVRVGIIDLEGLAVLAPPLLEPGGSAGGGGLFVVLVLLSFRRTEPRLLICDLGGRRCAIRRAGIGGGS